MYVLKDQILNPLFLSTNSIMTAMTLFEHNISECKMAIVMPFLEHEDLILSLCMIKYFYLVTR